MTLRPRSEIVGRCGACDADIYQGDTQCAFCQCTRIQAPYPKATTLDMAVANIFEHDAKESRIVAKILSGEWEERHGAAWLAGQVASEYHDGTGEWPVAEDAFEAVKRGLARKRAN